MKSFSPLEVRIAVVDYKKTSSFAPDFYASVMDEWKWIVYPWSLREDVKDLLKRKGVSDVGEAVSYLRSIGVDVDEGFVRDVLEDC